MYSDSKAKIEFRYFYPLMKSKETELTFYFFDICSLQKMSNPQDQELRKNSFILEFWMILFPNLVLFSPNLTLKSSLSGRIGRHPQEGFVIAHGIYLTRCESRTRPDRWLY